jgi:hypothetical protein
VRWFHKKRKQNTSLPFDSPASTLRSPPLPPPPPPIQRKKSMQDNTCMNLWRHYLSDRKNKNKNKNKNKTKPNKTQKKEKKPSKVTCSACTFGCVVLVDPTGCRRGETQINLMNHVCAMV